jgi:hypothetical protein
MMAYNILQSVHLFYASNYIKHFTTFIVIAIFVNFISRFIPK